MPIILDLCAGTGAWSKPYADAGYEVRPITLPDDIRLTHSPGPVHGILAAPPCTVFARSGCWYPRSPDDYLAAISVVDACFRFVVACRPKWWCLENPVGILRRWIGPPVMYFQPCDYGDPWTKKTALWGQFNPPAPTPVVPTLGSITTTKLGSGQRAERAKTPPGFAKAFFEANP